MKQTFNNFVKYVLDEVINKNEELIKTGYAYSIVYEYDSIDIIYNKIIDGILNELKIISLSEDEYKAGNKSDEDLLEALLNTIQSDS